MSGTTAAQTDAAAGGTDEPVVELRGVHVVFKARTGTLFRAHRVHAVDDVSVQVHRGRTLGIVGESGSGKSTMAKVLVGLQPPTSGEIRFRGETVRSYTPRVRTAVGRVVSVVFQDPATALNARMRVRDALRDPLDVHHVGDPTSRARRVAELADLKNELGLGMVFISHDIQTVRHVSDEIVVMRSGRIVEQGPAAHVLDDPQHDYTRTLLAAAPALLADPPADPAPEPTQHQNRSLT